MLTSRQLEAFRAVMITGTVTQAAGMLFVSQPAVSRIIADLEHEVGFKLFTRANRNLVPTAEGLALYDEVERAFVGLQQIDRAAAAIRQLHRGHLRLIAIPALASTVMAELIRCFLERYPEVAVSLEVQPSQRVFEWIASQRCDLGLTSMPIESASVAARQIGTAQAVCVLPACHPLTARSLIRPEDLAGLPFVSFRSDAAFRHRVDALFEQAAIARDTRLEARTTEAICALVAAGLGVSIIGPVVSAGPFPEGLVFRPFRPAIEQKLTLIHAASAPLSRVAGRFLEIAEDHVGNAGDTVAGS
ncbi:LysR substrate-binding domain-containing protein [Geminicoccaceae bacterium 1502E]|nr:LysR substrate-binding domain-containing protein [Geminicoccaceae bacterium 1502E]